MLQSTVIEQRNDAVLERMYQQLKIDHSRCTFHADMKSAPDAIKQMEISLSGKFRFIDGTTSVTMMEGKTAVERWFLPQQRVIFECYADNGNRLNRYWTQYSYPRQRVQKSDNMNVVLPPRLSWPGQYHNMAQIDIKSAYYSIMNIIGIHPFVRWGKSLGVGNKLDGYYPFTEYKTVRNSLYGTCFNPSLTFVTRGVGKRTKPKVKIANPQVIQITQTILHGIARQAANMGCVQWYTDGGILPADIVWEFMVWVGETYGLSCKLKCIGDAEVVRPDQYATPVHKPRRKIGGPQWVNTIDGFKEDYPYGKYEPWLQDKLKPWVARRSNPVIIDEVNETVWSINGSTK